MFWYRIVDWFNDLSERNRIVRNFNKSARDAFILVRPQLFWRQELPREIQAINTLSLNGIPDSALKQCLAEHCRVTK